jgi:phage baseplate assembly protein W
MTAGRAFLGKGWRFPLRPDARGALGYTEAGDNIEHSIKVVLLTRLGERVMRPEFGCDVGRMLFAPASLVNLQLIEQSVRSALLEFERRIDVLDVRAEQSLIADTRVDVAIRYRERRTNTVGNLVFPFYLDREGAGGPRG